MTFTATADSEVYHTGGRLANPHTVLHGVTGVAQALVEHDSRPVKLQRHEPRCPKSKGSKAERQAPLPTTLMKMLLDGRPA